MPTRAPKPCRTPGCGQLATTNGRCDEHQPEPDLTVAEKGYGAPHRRFQRAVLARESMCRLCGAQATVADHYPLSRRQLVAHGFNPNDPEHGRGLCRQCHNQQTATRQRGGWQLIDPDQRR